MRSGLSLLLCAAGLACGEAATPPPVGDPDVVVILADTLRPDRLSFYGAEKETAPFLAELAERSLVFEDVRSVSTWTAPAVASIFTSTWPEQHGVRTGMWAYRNLREGGSEVRINRIPRRFETLTEVAAGRGYTTFGISSNPNVSAMMGFKQGFDHFQLFVYNGIDTGRADRVVNRALAWKPELRAAEKFYLYLHFMDPHEPYVRNEEWIEEPSPAPANPFADRAAYDSEIRFMDEQIRRLFRELELGEDVLVLVTSDHGQEFEEHGGFGHVFTLYSELTRVPLLIHLPGPDAPRGRVPGRASTLDILPTFRALLGAPASDQDEGVALLRGGRPVPPPAREHFASRMRLVPDGVSPHKRSVLREDWKLIVSEPGSSELYDVASDPSEQRDLAAEQPERAAELRRRLDAHHRAFSAPAGEAVAPYRPSDAELEALRALGYADSPEDPRADVPAKR